MVARVRAELLRLLTQVPVWIFVGLLAFGAAWSARWSPVVVTLTEAAPPQLSVSIAGALQTATTHLATGLGVMLAAVFASAGPGRDFVDGSAETQQASGTLAQRLAGRVLAVALLVLASGIIVAALLVLAGVAIRARNDYGFRVAMGRLDATQVLSALVLAFAHSAWVVALAQRLRTQAGQLALPGTIVVIMFLVSRLSVHPVSPDSWVGPILGLQADRAMLDFWWSVGGKVLWPWGNVVLLAGTVLAIAAFGARADRRGRLARAV